MSTLKVSNIQDTAGANNSTPELLAKGTAKAWVNFNGTGTVAINAAYNVSSITDNGVGNYTVNFTNAMADANYSLAALANYTDTTNMADCSFYSASTTSVRLIPHSNAASTLLDCVAVAATVFR